MLNFRITEKSKLLIPGEVAIPRPEFPKQNPWPVNAWQLPVGPEVFCANALRGIQALIVRSEGFGLPTRNGRLVSPVFALSFVVTVRGSPVCNVLIPLI